MEYSNFGKRPNTTTLNKLGVIMLITMLSFGCSSTQPTVSDDLTNSSDMVENGPLKFVYVSPDPLGENIFLNLGKRGLEEAGAKHNADIAVLESNDAQSREANVRQAIEEGAHIVIVLGFQFGHIIPIVAAENPDIDFLIVDQCIDVPAANVYCAVFREHESAFLVGVIAGSLTKTQRVGAISAVDIPFIHRFTDGFADGVRYINPAVEVVPTLWIGGENPFVDRDRAKELALQMAADGVDHIFSATSGADVGVFEAAKEKNFFAYGVDVNQCPSMAGYVVENTIKRVDTAIIQAVDNIINGSSENLMVLGLAEGGVGIVSLTNAASEDNQCLIMAHPELIEQLKELRQEIIDGNIIINDPLMQ